jgi:hypothetical protein
MLQDATRTTTRNSSGPPSAADMGVWGNKVCKIKGRHCRVWLFILESQDRLTAYEHLPKREANAPENGCTFNGEGARHVRLERMRANTRGLPIMRWWSRKWDAARKVEVWTFVSERQQVFTAELMQSNCQNGALLTEEPQVWMHAECAGV